MLTLLTIIITPVFKHLLGKIIHGSNHVLARFTRLYLYLSDLNYSPITSAYKWHNRPVLYRLDQTRESLNENVLVVFF